MDIKIGKSARACCACGRKFEHEEPFTSMLRPDDEGLARSDYCKACWSDLTAPQAYSIWKANFYDPDVAEQTSPEFVSPLRQLFYEAVDATERPEMAMAFLAAQLLRRQKVFRLIKETQDPDTEAVVALFTDRIGNRLVEVKDPCLTHAELEVGRRLLLHRLGEIEGTEPEEGLEDGQSKDEYAQV